jgi:hypothetical protein
VGALSSSSTETTAQSNATPTIEPMAEATAAAPFFVPLTNLSVELGAATQVPLFVGAEVRVEGPFGVFVDGGVGVLPAPYFALLNGVFVAVGGYDQTTVSLIADAVNNALVVQLGGGWRPFAAHGVEVFGGYTFAGASGALPAVATVASVVGTEVPLEARYINVPLFTTLHAVHGGLAWRFDLLEGLYVRPSIGYVQVIGSRSGLAVEAADLDRLPQRVQPRVDDALRSVSGELDAFLNSTYVAWVKSPVVGVSIGWRCSFLP